jgi:surfeit locus 1 family protein
MVKQPRWILAIVVGVVITAGFVRLGFWQLDRLDQRRETNATIEGRLSEPTRPLEGILGHYGDDVDEMLYRRARVEGVYRIDDEFVSIGRIVSDESGILVATPLDLADGSVLIIVRGLVPPDTSGPPAQGYEPPLGTVSLVGRIDDGEEPLRIGESDPQDGHLEALSRIDLAYIDQWVDGDVLPITLILEEQSPTDRRAGPIRVPPDELTEGSHLGYAIQWFSFAIIVGVGVGLLVHRAGTRDDPNEGDPDRASPL